MIFYFGVALIIASIASFVITMRKMRRPQADAVIKEIRLEFAANDKLKAKKHLHALVSYTFKSQHHEALIFLLKRKVQIGDQVTVTFKEDAPQTPVMFAKSTELIGAISLFLAGAVLIYLSYYFMQMMT